MAHRSNRQRLRPIAALALEAGTTIGPRCANVHLGPGGTEQAPGGVPITCVSQQLGHKDPYVSLRLLRALAAGGGNGSARQCARRHETACNPLATGGGRRRVDHRAAPHRTMRKSTMSQLRSRAKRERISGSDKVELSALNG